MVFKPEAYKAIDGRFSDCRGGGACIGGGGFVEVATAARNACSEVYAVMFFEYELSANAYQCAFVKVLEFNAVLVSAGRIFDSFLELDIFGVERVLEPEEK